MGEGTNLGGHHSYLDLWVKVSIWVDNRATIHTPCSPLPVTKVVSVSVPTIDSSLMQRLQMSFRVSEGSTLPRQRLNVNQLPQG
jgi:hypothetical protein